MIRWLRTSNVSNNTSFCIRPSALNFLFKRFSERNKHHTTLINYSFLHQDSTADKINIVFHIDSRRPIPLIYDQVVAGGVKMSDETD